MTVWGGRRMSGKWPPSLTVSHSIWCLNWIHSLFLAARGLSPQYYVNTLEPGIPTACSSLYFAFIFLALQNPKHFSNIDFDSVQALRNQNFMKHLIYAIMFVFAKRHSRHAAAQFSSINPRFVSHSPTDVQKAQSSWSFLHLPLTCSYSDRVNTSSSK